MKIKNRLRWNRKSLNKKAHKSQGELRCEFWNFLHSQGFPSSINDSAILLATKQVNAEASEKEQWNPKYWSFVSGGEHYDDVSLTMLLANELGLKQDVDWDWRLELDCYHFDIVFSKEKAVDELLRLLELYHEASLVFLKASVHSDAVERFDLQQLLAEEWRRLREEKRRLEAETIQAIRKFFNGLEVREGD